MLVFLALLSLFGMSFACFDIPTEAYLTMTTMEPTTVTTVPLVPTKAVVTRQPTGTNSCTGTENGTLLKVLTQNVASTGAGDTVTATYTFQGTGTQTALCYSTFDRNTGASVSTFAKTGGAYGTNSLIITATSAVGASVNADVYIIGTL